MLNLKKSAKTILILGFCLIIIGFESCKKEDEEKGPINIEFLFEHNVGTGVCEFDTIKYTNAAGNNYSVVTLRYFISDITLIKEDGSEVKIDDEHYIDANDNTTLSYKPDNEIENGLYTGISFVFGLDTVKNKTGNYLNPPESNMEWPAQMGGGYHYMKLEGKHDSLGVTKSYNVHTGKAMGDPYHFIVSLSNSSFTVDGESLTITMAMDINKWFENPNIYDFNNFGSAIMGNKAAQTAIQQNGVDVFTISSIQ